jgi:hypothetical protein
VREARWRKPAATASRARRAAVAISHGPLFTLPPLFWVATINRDPIIFDLPPGLDRLGVGGGAAVGR